MQDRTLPARPGADSFGSHDFHDLWIESVVGEATALRADDAEADTDPDITLFNLLNKAIKVDDRGVWIKKIKTAKKVKKAKPALGVELWSPRIHERDAGHWRDMPALPFPFSPGELAAFMLAGPGWWLGEAFGGLDQLAPDLSRIPVGRDMVSGADRTARMLTMAWEAYRAAERAFGPRPVDPSDEKRWLGVMCRRLLGQSDQGTAAAPIGQPARRQLAKQTHPAAIAEAVRRAGFDPEALPAITSGKRCPAKAAAFNDVVPKIMTKRAFEDHWKDFQRGRRSDQPGR